MIRLRRGCDLGFAFIIIHHSTIIIAYFGLESGLQRNEPAVNEAIDVDVSRRGWAAFGVAAVVELGGVFVKRIHG